MKLNLNRFSGIMVIFFLGGACASFPASFLFRANYDDITGSVFTILGASFLMVAAFFILINATETKNGKSDMPENITMKFIFGLLGLTIVTGVVMVILGEFVRFW
jgi:hypothetical protein